MNGSHLYFGEPVLLKGISNLKLLLSGEQVLSIGRIDLSELAARGRARTARRNAGMCGGKAVAAGSGAAFVLPFSFGYFSFGQAKEK